MLLAMLVFVMVSGLVGQQSPEVIRASKAVNKRCAADVAVLKLPKYNAGAAKSPDCSGLGQWLAG